MAKKNKVRTDITLEGSQATWHINMHGNVQGTYMGKFKFKCVLNPTQKISANREYRELLGPNPLMVPEYESNLAYSLTQLKYRIIEAPPFWNASLQTSSYAGDIPDDNIISAVLDAAIEAELMFQSEIGKKTAEALERAKKAAEKILNQKQEEDEEGEPADADQG